MFVCARKAAEEEKKENVREATLASMLICTHALLARTTPCTRRNIHFQTHAYTCSYANTRMLLLSLRGLLSKNKFLPKKQKKQKRPVSGQPSKLSTAFIGYKNKKMPLLISSFRFTGTNFFASLIATLSPS